MVAAEEEISQETFCQKGLEVHRLSLQNHAEEAVALWAVGQGSLRLLQEVSLERVPSPKKQIISILQREDTYPPLKRPHPYPKLLISGCQ